MQNLKSVCLNHITISFDIKLSHPKPSSYTLIYPREKKTYAHTKTVCEY